MTNHPLALVGLLAIALSSGCAWSGWAQCGDETVNVNSHPMHCGACHWACPDGIACEQGQCRFSDNLTVCLTEEATPYTLPLNYSAVLTLASQYDPDDFSQLTVPYLDPSGPPPDDGVRLYAADLEQDAANCGWCGLVCPPEATCEQGVCSCPAATTLREEHDELPSDIPYTVDQAWIARLAGREIQRACVPTP